MQISTWLECEDEITNTKGTPGMSAADCEAAGREQAASSRNTEHGAMLQSILSRS